jgi:UDP-glucose 4-epimerase
MQADLFTGKRVLITGGTGSLGKVLLRRILSEERGKPAKVTVFSRDEAKQHAMRVEYMNAPSATEEVIYNNFRRMIDFRIGDVRDIETILPALAQADIVVNAAAMKQVPACEYFPEEAVRTNVLGAENIVRTIRDHGVPVETVVCISTDKACKPINVMGMTKSIQERIFLRANLDCPRTRFVAVRYGNVIASRGSVIPLFHEQIRQGGPVTITHEEMTRFLLSLQQAVDIIFEALANARRGEMYVPHVPSVRVTDLARLLIGERPIRTVVTGIRPGEKLHEILISEEEGLRAFQRGKYYVIANILPELREESEAFEPLGREYSSADDVMSERQAAQLLAQNQVTNPAGQDERPELLR